MNMTKIGTAGVLASGTAIVDGHELMVVEGNGARLTFAWIREDDNMIIGGHPTDIRVDLPIARPATDVVHDVGVGDSAHRLTLRFYVAWLHERARIVTYTLLTAS